MKTKELWDALIPPLRETIAPQNVFPSSGGYRDSQLYDFFTTGSQGAAGYAVNERTAMSVSAVYAAIGLIAGAIQSMPIGLFRRGQEGKEPVNVLQDNRAANIWWLLNEQPQRAWSAAVFWEYVICSILLCGDAFVRIDRGPGGNAIALTPLYPYDVQVDDNELLDEGLVYTITDDGKTYSKDQDDILHIPGLGFDGYRGMSPLRYAAKNSISTALAAEDYSGTFFRNGARPDLVVTVPGGMDKERQEQFRDAWNQRFGGAWKSHAPAVLTNGADIKPISMSAEDTQIIETRRFQVEDIARVFGVPPHMIGANDKSTSWGSGIEHMSIAFVRYTLQRHLTKIEQELNRKLFPRSLRWFAEFKTEGLERGDLKSRYEAHRIALGRAGEPGWKTPNEIRKIENDPPLPDGDTLNTGMPATNADPATV